ncbi:MAG TPA: hypothetical protein VK586_03995 [Streptosporangiaceae bacterium]|nr:hypothetical protein [Streptosporangiaceae bacterium]
MSQTIAIGRVAADAGWAGITAIEYLQVEDGNAAARNLYEGMGFAGHQRYHYRITP